MLRRGFAFAIVACFALSHWAFAGDEPTRGPHKLPPGTKALPLGLIAKSQSNPVFQAARVGAEDAAKEWSKKLGIEVTVDWRTPMDENPQKQAEFLEQLTIKGTRGVSIACSDAKTLTDAINRSVSRGVAVMCFDSDAPQSKRFAYHGTNDEACGRQCMQELVKAIGAGGGTVAILAGNANAPNLQKRVKAAREEAAKHANIKVKDVYYHKETPQDAAAKVEQVQTANPDIVGWCMVGGWPLFTDVLLKWQPGKTKVVAVDALEAQLPYVDKGIAQVLLAQDCYKWGYRSVDLLVAKIAYGEDPKETMDFAPLIPVTKDNSREFGKNWKKWLRKP